MRLLRTNEVRVTASMVGKNYSREYELLARRELGDMFSSRGGPRPIYFVAEEQGRIVGFAGYIQSWMDYNIYQIFWVNVLPDHQRHGIGKMLVARLIQEIQKKKGAFLILLTADARKGLPDYYARHFGFSTLQKFSPNYHLMSLPVNE